MCRFEADRQTRSLPLTLASMIYAVPLGLAMLIACPTGSAQTPAAPIAQIASSQTSSSPTSNMAPQDDLALEPYPVYVAHDKMYARCGPSEEYYRTDPLRRGQQLDVYAETENGWLGIRPPADSFCWIPADAAQLDTNQETGTIIEDRTVAWIGTHLGRARSYRWQVQLAKGEPITVVGRSEREGPDGPQLWFRIVPPSGEYRWVHRTQIVFSSEELVEQLKTEAEEKAQQSPPPKQPTVAASLRRQQAPPESQPAADSDAFAESTRAMETSNQPRSVLASSNPIGSGLKPDLKTDGQPKTVVEAIQQSGLLASLEFLGQPRLLEIGSAPVAPQPPASADDDNWVTGPRPARQSLASQQLGTQQTTNQRTYNTPPAATNSIATTAPPASVFPTSPIATNSLPGTSSNGISVAGPNQVATASPNANIITSNDWSATRVSSLGTVMQVSNEQAVPIKQTIVPAHRIAQIQTEVQYADFDQLSLVFSRLIAAQATAAEIEPVERAALQLATSAPDAVIAGRARLLAERAQQYSRVATRRDGASVIRNHVPLDTAPASYNVPILNNSGTPTGATQRTNLGQPVKPNQAQTVSQSGYLVQVYSARRGSPPFALTDDTGRTIAYASPLPGVNLRVHLNSQVTLIGKPNFLAGLNTPHLYVAEAARTPER